MVIFAYLAKVKDSPSINSHRSAYEMEKATSPAVSMAFRSSVDRSYLFAAAFAFAGAEEVGAPAAVTGVACPLTTFIPSFVL